MTEYSFFDGRMAANFICNYREADPWWVFAPGFDKESVKKIVNSNITVAPSGSNAWYQSASVKISDDGESGVFPRMHTNSIKVIIFSGTDPEAPEDLGAEVFFTVEDETYSFTKPFIAVIPKGCRYGGIYTVGLRRPYIITEILPSAGFNGCDLNELDMLPVCHLNRETLRESGKYTMCFLPYNGGEELSIALDANPYGKGKKVSVNTALVSSKSAVRPEPMIAEKDMYISLLSTDSNDLRNLDSEFEFVFEDEIRKIDISCMIYIPKGSSYIEPYFTNVRRTVLVTSVSV